ncbi:MAG TPA: nucleotidyl transferase AbiEii/AbiGii toxin family protein [Stellaceae bacterium]|nr:nucleotidyl transferase AbiEii/AbiGii toxin family protein [Stellaceae bacterium]
MALTKLQTRVLRAIAQNRSPDSHVAGGTALTARSPRISKDIDIFHDAQEGVEQSVRRDVASLEKAGLSLEVTPRGKSFVEGVVKDEHGDEVKIEWAQDSAVRFFPAIADEVFGYRLQELDLAVNKVLAMAGRREPRDYYDVVRLHQQGIPLAALVWAAPAKDPGFTPELLLDEINRNSNYPDDQLRADIDAPDLPSPRELKQVLIDASRQARDLFARLPLDQVGYLYLDRNGRAVLPDPEGVREGRLTLHGAALRGALPQLSPGPSAAEAKPAPRRRPRP